MRAHGQLSGEKGPDLGPDLGSDLGPDFTTLSRAAHAFLARTPSLLAMAQLDDLVGEADPVNVPATSDEHPNWRRRLSVTLEELSTHPSFRQGVAILREIRGPQEGIEAIGERNRRA